MWSNIGRLISLGHHPTAKSNEPFPCLRTEGIPQISVACGKADQFAGTLKPYQNPAAPPKCARRFADVIPTSFLPLKFVIDGLTRVGNITPDTFDGFTGRQSKDSENKSDTEHGKPLGHWLDLGQTNGPSGCRQDYKNIAFRWRGKPPPRPRTLVVFQHVTSDRHPES